MYCDRHVDSPWTEFHPQSLVKVWPGQRTVSTGMQSLKKDQREHLLDTDILTVRECQILKSPNAIFHFCVPSVFKWRCESCISQCEHWGLCSCHILWSFWSNAIYDPNIIKDTEITLQFLLFWADHMQKKLLLNRLRKFFKSSKLCSHISKSGTSNI